MVNQEQFGELRARIVNQEQFEELRLKLVAYESQQSVNQFERVVHGGEYCRRSSGNKSIKD